MLNTIHIDIKQLTIHVRDSKHNIVYRSLSPLIHHMMKFRVIEAMKSQIRDAFEFMDQQITYVKVEGMKERQPTAHSILDEDFQMFLHSFGFENTLLTTGLGVDEESAPEQKNTSWKDEDTAAASKGRATTSA